jgi:ribosome biogenesis GTPase / thiamine phosphate phosphatase
MVSVISWYAFEAPRLEGSKEWQMSIELQQTELWGWDAWLGARAAELGVDEHRIARVTAVDREQLVVMTRAGEHRVKLSGHFLHLHDRPDFPCVGDWVYLKQDGTDTPGLVEGVLPRKSMLRRKAAGCASEPQMIAANVDEALVVQSCHYDFNVNRLKRYLVMVADGNVRPLIVLTKTDLVQPEVLAQLVQEIRDAGITTEIIALSSLTGVGLDSLQQRLLPGKTYCLLGSSGVGKSTLINEIMGKLRQDTKTVSGSGEGRHTTVRRELVLLLSGAMLIDNPGMREFGVMSSTAGMQENFADIDELAERCRYKDCSHENESGCAVLQALDRGELSRANYDNFVKLRSESEFNNMSYLEKRTKDKAFGRFLKSAKQSLKKR